MADEPDIDAWLASKKAADPPVDEIDAWLASKAAANPPPAEVLADPNAVAALRLARGVKSPRKVSGADSTIRALENRAEAAGFGAGNAATFGMMNRGFGLADDIRTGAPWGTGTDKMVAREAEVQKQYPGYHLAGSVLGGVGTGVGLARGGIGISREGLGLAGRVGAGAAEGAAFGAASGAGQTYSGNLPDYLKNATIGGAFGTAGGAIGEGVGAAAGNIYNRVRDARGVFPEPVVRGARADVEGLENLPRLGPDAMLPDAGPSMQATAQQAALGIGPNRTSIVNALMERDLGTVPRLRADTEAAIGPAPRVSAVEEGIDAGRRQINTEYAPVLQGRVIEPGEANRVMGRLNELAVTTRTNLDDVVQSLTMPGHNLPDLSPQSWLRARQRVDSMIEAANSPVNPDRYRASVLGEVRRMIDDELAANVPGVKAVDAKFAANRAELEALQTGRNVLDTGKQAVHPEDLRDLLQTQAAPQGLAPPGPPAANVRLRQGARAEIDRRVGTKANDLVELERTMGTPQDWNAQKLNQIFGPEAAQAVRDSVARNRQFRETYQRIAQGSDTAQRQAAAKTADVSAQQMPIRNLAGTAEQLGRMGLAQVMEARKQAQREAIATLMATRDPAEVARLRAALLAHIQAGAPGAARAAQTGRGVLQGVGMGIGPAADDYLQW